ncbi:MAG: hypothetical protein KVP17_002467 [Porospora cf. gigantea B]|uniref:uncharacterized protein n=1 Tax=Porospora cf. gigantea B TaxID=2853592 RepID=UPI003571BE72|nr:MAG: hypothetical protein KVP17_002467 [Porospora cf. gigantea B]
MAHLSRHELAVQHFQTLMSTLSLITPVLLFFLGEYRSRLVGYDVYNSVILGYIGFLYLLTPLVFFTAKSHTHPQTLEWEAEETSSELSDGAGSSNDTPDNVDHREPEPQQPFVLLGSSLPRVSEKLPMAPLQGFETATKNWRNQVRSLPFLICALYMFNVNFRRAYFLANFREICFDFVKDPAEAHSLQMFYNYVSVVGFLGTLAWAFLVEQSVQMMLWFSTSVGILIQLSLCFTTPAALRVAAVLFAFYNTNIYVEIYYVITELFGQTSSNFLQGLMFTAGGLGACCVLPWNRVVSVYFQENWAVQNALMLLLALFSLSLPAYRLLQDRAEAKKQNPERKASYV